MNRPIDSNPVLPVWVRVADALTFLLALAALRVAVFGGIQIGTVFSMSTPWRALCGLIVICGLRHYIVRMPAIHQRVWNRLRPAQRRLAQLTMHYGQSRPVRFVTYWWHRNRSACERWLPVRALRTEAGPRLIPSEAPGAARFEALHVVGLWGVAVAQPIFDLVARSPEFFVAHDTRPGDLLALVALLCLGGPAACLLVIHVAGRAGGPRWRRRATAAVIGSLAGAVALTVLKPLTGWPGSILIGLAATAGAAAAVAYQRFAPVHLFATFLAPAAVVVPAVFLFNPAVASLLAPADEIPVLDGVTFAATPPVVVVVFDQFQLASLLDREGNINRAVFPHFAALADDATWFRNATAVAEVTSYALPAILTGTYPSPDRLPVVADHPANLFTLLGGRYRLHVHEPLTGLCPEALCPPDRAAAGGRLAGVLRDLAVVYLTVVLPDELAARLPPVTQSWNDFTANQTFQRRWQAARVDDRSATVTRFIKSITGAAGPALHFMHVLLPHEPWLYLPTGQQFTLNRHTIGLRDGKWVDDRWAAALNHQRYLLQVGYVDTLLGRLVARLREVGIYDDALIVITADHGASLRPGLSVRRADESSFADIAAVPLFVKRAAQRRGEVVDANVEVIDILPTVAAELGADVPWTTDGTNAFDPARTPRSSKLMFFDNARNQIEVPGDLRAGLLQSVARKFDLFETGDPMDAPTPDGRYDDLIGRAAGEMRARESAAIEVVVDTLPLLRDVDPDADFVPAHITGAVTGLRDGATAPAMAVTVNGVVAAVTRPYAFPVLGRRAAWEAIIDPRLLKSGANTVEVFEILADASDGALTLAATRGDTDADPWPNLIRDEEAQPLGVRASGFYGMEWAGTRLFRWTRGDARLLVPLDPRSPPAAITVDVLMTARPKRFRVAVDGCVLSDETILNRWTATFPLDDCRLVPPDLEIVLLSDTHVSETPRDNRTLGVGVSLVELRGEIATR